MSAYVVAIDPGSEHGDVEVGQLWHIASGGPGHNTLLFERRGRGAVMAAQRERLRLSRENPQVAKWRQAAEG